MLKYSDWMFKVTLLFSEDIIQAMLDPNLSMTSSAGINIIILGLLY